MSETPVTQKVVQTNSVGYKLTFNAPATVEEYDRLAGKVGACLEDAIDNTIYRGTLAKWQDAFAPKLAELTGLKRGIDTVATEKSRARSKNPDKVKDIPEKFKSYNNRVVATYAGEDEAKLKELADLAQTVADAISVDPSPSARAAAIPKEYTAKAESLLTLDADALDAKVEKLLGRVPTFALVRDVDGLPEVESLARLIQAFVLAPLDDI